VYPAVILITGSGPQDRNETLFNHQPFTVIADYLTKKGFVVLRTDDRGVGESTGSFSKATSADFANDVDAAVDFLKQQPQVDVAHIGLMGHSEGGMIAPVVASRRKDIHEIILLAGPGIPIIDLMAEQAEAVAASNTKNADIITAAKELFTIAATEMNRGNDTALIKKNIIAKEKEWASGKNKLVLLQMNLLKPEAIEAQAIAQFNSMNGIWYKYFLGFNPQPYLEKLSCNVLALNGSKDIQVLPASNLAGIKTFLQKSKSKHYEVIEMPGLNHLFQTCKTCNVAEYAELEESFSPAALEVIANWLAKYGR
jgi:pimeloyl-ACP methyl ester carboxylesterase